jgi:hypothetical protein
MSALMKTKKEGQHGGFGQREQSSSPFALDPGETTHAQGGLSPRRDDSPHPDHVISCGTGVEALVPAMLDGDHALDKVGSQFEERGMLPLLRRM